MTNPTVTYKVSKETTRFVVKMQVSHADETTDWSFVASKPTLKSASEHIVAHSKKMKDRYSSVNNPLIIELV